MINLTTQVAHSKPCTPGRQPSCSIILPYLARSVYVLTHFVMM